MAASTVAYTDTTGNKDYLGMIASQIGRRLKEASDMASDERDFAAKKAEAGGTSLEEAGIGKGYFFKRALGSRFGGDRIARTRGRMGATGAGTSPTGNFKTRFRGGFDYNVANEIQSATAPVTGALATGLRGVEGGLVEVGRGIDALAVGLGNLARAQEDMARQAVFNGAFMQAFLNHMQREGARQRARGEERGLEGRRLLGGGSGGGRGMINVTPSGGSGGGVSGGMRGLLNPDSAQTIAKATTNVKGLKQAQTGAKAVKQAFRSSGVSNVFGITKAPRTITKAMANKNVIKSLGGAGSKVNKQIVKAVRKSGLADTAVKGTTAVRSVKGAERLSKALQMANDIESADAFAKGMQNLGMEDALIKKIYGTGGEALIPKKQAAKGFASLVDGSFDGTTRSTDEALAAWKYLFGEDQYKKLMTNADVPIEKAMKSTFTHKMLKAPKISKALTTAGKNTMAKTLLKKIPVIAGIAGIIFGIQRALEGDFVGAGLEITSGLLGATGKGAGLSLAIDGYLLGRDMGMMPMANGGFLTRPTPVVAGEAGAEGFFPLEGARGKKTFKMFGEGVVQAQLDNDQDVASVMALGNKKYFDDMGGWEKFGEGIMNLIRGLTPDVGSEKGDGFIGPSWLGIRNPFASDNSSGAPAPNGTSGSLSGSGSSTMNLSDDQYKWLAYAISGEAALGTDDMFGVAASILNRAARGDEGGSIEDIIKAPGQYEAYEKGMMSFSPDIEALLKSPEGNAKLIEALMRLDGRTDFKGQSQLGNRVASEDPMFHKLGNFFHYDWQTGTNSVMPDNFVKPNFQKFINSSGTGNEQANLLQQLSASLGVGGQNMFPTTIINNNYATSMGSKSGDDDDAFGLEFPSGFTGYIVPYSLSALK